ncbi:MAG: protein kinase [Candidatus Eisenbacteria bacterium]|nr:protein kinase [Candidatus Eisenbacteria bacterium]
MIGSKLSRYTVVERLGAGGMGEVYRARDDRLQRDVAIKVLPAGARSGDDERRRFRNEALALSRLSHPGIAVVHDFDSQDGTDFIVMELIAGATLEERLRGGPIAEAEAAPLAAEIAEALAAAHEQGVLHRDLKPGNIVVTPDGRAKVLDFGLARLLEAGDDSRASTVSAAATRSLVGTPAYMAPEVLRDEPVDPRTDLYSLGVVLFEMTTGRLPFPQRLPSALILDITQTPPPAPRDLRPEISPDMESLILRLLAKDPAARPRSARELADALRRLGEPAGRAAAGGDAGAEPRPPIASLAVLPLENLSGDPDQEFFADGMTDALIMDLAQIGALRVISRTSAMQYKGRKGRLPDIARELNVDAIVEGSVLRAGDRVRISARLIDAATERHLWAKRYERDAGDVLALQGEVARAIADEVRVKLTPREAGRLNRPRAVRPEALDAYLRGRHHWNRRLEPEVRKSIEHFQRAIEFDPGYALAFAGLADAWNILADLRALPQGEAFERARAAAERAMALDPSLGEPHTSLGFVLMFNRYDWPAAAAEYERAIALHPGYATGHQWYAELLASQGRFGEALAEARHAERLDPLSAVIGASVADILYFERRYDEAIEQLRRVLELDPAFLLVHPDLGRAYAQAGDFDRAIAEFEQAATLAGGLPGSSAGLAHTLAVAGRRDEARAMLPALEARVRTGRMNPYAIATVLTGLGDLDAALDWMERAFEQRDGGLVWLQVHPRLDPLRGHPRFAALAARMGFP